MSNRAEVARPRVVLKTRSDAITSAIRQEIDRRRALIDSDLELIRWTVTVKLQAGTDEVRGVSVEEDRLARRLPSGEYRDVRR